MRVIKIELPAALTAADPSISLASDDIRAQLFKELKALDTELSETVRQKAKAYFPDSYSVFVRTLLSPDKVTTTSELWIVDPNIRWPAGLLTRRAWTLFIPILAHVVREAMSSRFEGVNFEMKEDAAKITVLAPARAWHDPIVVGLAVLALTTLFWIYIEPILTPSLASVTGQ
ncbi:MAG: hypothetical protein ABL894_02185 [Hyphomicrobium sp.]